MNVWQKRVIWFFGFWLLMILETMSMGIAGIDPMHVSMWLGLIATEYNLSLFLFFVWMLAVIVPLLVMKDDIEIKRGRRR